MCLHHQWQHQQSLPQYHLFKPGGDKFNDKAGGTLMTSMCNDDDSIGSNSSSCLSVCTAHRVGNYSIIYDSRGDAVDLTLDICKSTDKGSDWYTDLEPLAGAATWCSHHWHTQHYNANPSSLSFPSRVSVMSHGMGPNDQILLSGGYDDDSHPDNGQRRCPACDKIDRPGKLFMEILSMHG
jgi:hypothetical protein